MVHLEPSVECYGCYRKFTTYPAMILHLESGACPSDVKTTDLNESAAMCFQWAAYIGSNFRAELLNRGDPQSNYSGPVYSFRCPGCDAEFAKLSGLFQHVCSKSCDQYLCDGTMAKLVKWLGNRHNIDEDFSPTLD